MDTSEALLSFSLIDYVLFFLLFGLSAVIGIYYGCFGNKQSTTKDYLHGGKKMKVFPVAMSLIASNLSGISLLGIPSEIYKYGTQYLACILSLPFMYLIIAYTFLPVFYKLQLNSTYEYLKMRFDNRVRILASVLFAITGFLYIPIVVYVPALAFNQVTGMNIYLVTPIISAICIFYTTIGGLKTVVWTDTLQFSMTLLTLGFILIMGTVSVGGFANVWEKAKDGDRLDIFNWDPNPTLRSTFWSVAIGQLVTWLSTIGVGPSTVQRCLALPSLKKAKLALLFYVLGTVLTKAICGFTGLIMYTKYFNCDPFTNGKIQKFDQILPFYVLDVAKQIPGISGLFIAGVFSTALSTLSTYLNSLSGIVYVDFIAPFMPLETSEKKASNIMKLTVVILGSFCILLVFLVDKLGTVLELSISLGGVTVGPLLGLFILGMCLPIANAKGALWGGLVSLFTMSWLIFKNQSLNFNGLIVDHQKNLSISGCQDFISQNSTKHMIPVAGEGLQEPFWLYRISFYYYTLMGTLITIFFGLLISWATKNKKNIVDPDLLSPFVAKLYSKSIKYSSVEKALNYMENNEKFVKDKIDKTLIN